ncbi:MAG: P1 family peptidase [Candidatus Bathyarchaeia archaeon]|jgi:D-aminopeptidase
MQKQNDRPRARDIGINVGPLATGPANTITDVPGLAVGHETVIRGQSVRTGVTAILPHTGNIFRDKVPAAVYVGNGFGKFVGLSQVNELGEIETPILLTNTLSVGRVADALIDYVLAIHGNEDVGSVNPIVGETNDGFLNDIRGKHVGSEEVNAALRAATTNPPEEGCVGAGTGTIALGFKGGIGSASRRLPPELGSKMIGVLVQSNFGGSLTIKGAPVGTELNGSHIKGADGVHEVGSVVVVIATDTCLDSRNLRRLAARSQHGLARTGYVSENRSGDYFIAFSTLKRNSLSGDSRMANYVRNEDMTPLFNAVIEATEEAVYNSLLRATTMSGRDNHVAEALPIQPTREVLQRHNIL